MSNEKEDNRTAEEILADMKKKQANGQWVFGKVMSYDETRNANKQISNYNAKITTKEKKKSDKEFKRSLKNKPQVFISIADFFQKIFHIIVTLYSMAIVINALFIWQIYKIVCAVGWKGIFQTKYILFIVLYFVILFVLKKVYYAFYKYAKD